MKRPASVLPLYYVDFISATPSSCVQSPDPNKIYSFPIYQSLEILITSEKLYPCHFGHLRRRGILKIFAQILCTDRGIVGSKMFMHAKIYVKIAANQTICIYKNPEIFHIFFYFGSPKFQNVNGSKKRGPLRLNAGGSSAQFNTHFEMFKGESVF